MILQDDLSARWTRGHPALKYNYIKHWQAGARRVKAFNIAWLFSEVAQMLVKVDVFEAVENNVEVVPYSSLLILNEMEERECRVAKVWAEVTEAFESNFRVESRVSVLSPIAHIRSSPEKGRGRNIRRGWPSRVTAKTPRTWIATLSLASRNECLREEEAPWAQASISADAMPRRAAVCKRSSCAYQKTGYYCARDLSNVLSWRYCSKGSVLATRRLCVYLGAYAESRWKHSKASRRKHGKTCPSCHQACDNCSS